jgi:hypothetical protein
MDSQDFSPPHPLNTAVLFLVFNRPDTTKQVFEAIKQAKPPKLYIAADGPRDTREGEGAKCREVRTIIDKGIDWDCQVHRLYREKNLGCKVAVSSAIDWFFENVEEGIILEDDCLPSQSFFWFCEELLDKYKDDMRVGQISGFNYGYSDDTLKYDYFFSKYPMIWGWASWRNRWVNYDLRMLDFEEFVETNQMSLMFNQKHELEKRKRNFYDVKDGKIDTWDYQWSFTLYKNKQFSIIPKDNFVLNLGFGGEGTHTKGKSSFSNIQQKEMSSINHDPKYIFEIVAFYNLINRTNFFSKLKSFFK